MAKSLKSRAKPPSLEKPSCCGCSTPAASPGPGGQAFGVDADLKRANLQQLRRIEGQVRGIASMIESDRYCADIVTQVAAARESLHTVARNLLRNHLQHCVWRIGEHGPAARDEVIDELLELMGKIAR